MQGPKAVAFAILVAAGSAALAQSDLLGGVADRSRDGPRDSEGGVGVDAPEGDRDPARPEMQPPVPEDRGASECPETEPRCDEARPDR